MNAAQIAALVIFIIMFVLIITDKIERQWVTLGAGVLTLIIVFGIIMQSPSAAWQTLNLTTFGDVGFWYVGSGHETVSIGINWSTIIFVAGMMIMVAGMEESGFFRWLCLRIAKAVHYKVIPILITFMIMSFVLSMFIDSITVILFLAAVTIELAQLLKFPPVPMILAEIFCANLGGSATMCGDPPNIIIGTSLGYTFFDFMKNTGVIAVICFGVILVYFLLICKKPLTAKQKEGGIDVSKIPDPKDAITDKKHFAISWVIFLAAVVLLITHAQTGFTVALIGVVIAAVTLISYGKRIPKILKTVDYKTLLFFIGLFIVVGGLEQTGVLELIANWIENVSGGNALIMVAIIIWVSAIASAFVDNIPFSATMVPVIQSLAGLSGVDLHVLAWTLSIGTDIGGSMTPIGASANVVGISTAERSGYVVTWGKYLKMCAPATIIVVALSMLIIFVRYGLI